MSFAVLDATIPEQLAAWIALWERWPDREIFAHPHYGRLFTKEGERTLAAVCTGQNGGVIYPFILRPLSALPWTAADEPGWDLVSPYGYSGAFSWGEQPAGFWDSLSRWAKSNLVVSGFTRLSLFEEQLLDFPGRKVAEIPNVVRGLELDDEALFSDYEHKVRKNVKRARRENLVVEFDQSGARLDDFLRIYTGTMDRREAALGYYFDERFFRAIVDDLPGQWLFAHVLDEQQVVSTELVLVSQQHIYSFLGGTISEAFPKRPNDLLKHEVARWGREQGKQSYVLGGGYGGPDGIFKYKKAFAPNGVRQYYSGRMVFDSAAYEALGAARRSAEPDWTPGEGYFPTYRAAGRVVCE
jgi:hypothetical protein